MKKMLLVGLAVVFLSLASLSSAEEYAVKGRDCLSKIGQQSGVAWQQIAKVNNINAPYTIYVGQKLEIPSATPVARQKTAVPIPASTQYLDEIRLLQAQICELEKKLNQAATVAREKEEAPAPVVTGIQTRSDAQVARQEAGVKQENVVSSMTARTEAPAKVELPVVVYAAEQTKPYIADDKYGAYMTGGGWKSFDTDKDSRGEFLSAQIAYRPILVNMLNHDVRLGGFLLGEIGSGTSLGKYDFEWYKLGGGFSSKIYGNNWDDTTNLGLTGQWDSSNSSKQTTYAVYLSNYLNLEQRRGAGEKWFPQTEVGLYGSFPFSASKENNRNGQSMTADNKFSVGLEVKQSLYDFSLNKNHKLVPGLMGGIGVEGDNFFGKLGPFIKWRAFNQDILVLEGFGKKTSSVEGFRGYGLLSANFDGIRKAVKAAGITEPTAADLTVSK